jgi:hypothetical protein
MSRSAFREGTDPFATGGTEGISKNALDNIPKKKITTVNFTDAAGNNSCSVCLQVRFSVLCSIKCFKILEFYEYVVRDHILINIF